MTLEGNIVGARNLCLSEQSYARLKNMDFEFRECGKKYLS